MIDHDFSAVKTAQKANILSLLTSGSTLICCALPATLVAIEKGAPNVQIGHYARALWLLEIQDAFLGNFGLPEIRVAPDKGSSQP